jgi:diaminopimelate epimerase
VARGGNPALDFEDPPFWMTPLSFHKYEGLGNDFVVVEGGADMGIDRARALCERHFGVGADGILIVDAAKSPGARASMIVINADGSRPEMCGNGLRCVALFLAERDGVDQAEYVLDTDAGPRAARVERSGGQAMVLLDMGSAQLCGDSVATFAAQEYVLTRVSMGNPHAIVFDAGFDASQMDELGPLVSAALPGGSNVESVMARGPRSFEVIVWERGVGRTLACGSGAAAVGVALCVTGRAPFDEPLDVRLPGGPLEIVVSRDSLRVSLRGPARYVFSGQVKT